MTDNYKRKFKNKTISKKPLNFTKEEKRVFKEKRFDSKVQLARIFRIVSSLFIQFWHVDKSELVKLAIVFRKVSDIWRTSGLKFTILYMKSVRLHVTKYMVGQPLVIRGIVPVKVSLDKDYFPKILGDFKYLFTSENAKDVERGLTLLSISRAFRRGPKVPLSYDLNSITDKRKGVIKTLNESVIRKVIQRMNLPKLRILDLTEEDLTIFNSAGPDGPSTKTCMITLARMKEYLFGSLLTLTGKFGKTYLKSARYQARPRPYFPCLDSTQWNKDGVGGWSTNIKYPITDTSYSPLGYNFVRKLAVVEDPELKARVVAIFDHFSQNILNMLSKQMYNMLKKIPSDRTFTQSPFFDHEGYKTDENSKYYSLDLSSATDRFPISLQLDILHHFGLSRLECSAWSKVMIEEAFKAPPGGVLDDPVWYRVGQPMGARSSWPAFTLSHHVLVRYCAWQLGMKDFHNYIILGDDIVIHNDQVAKYYIRLMGHLGVELSLNKTHTSFTHWEFAKRWIRKGVEVSGIPISGISDNINSLGTILQIFHELFVVRRIFPVVDFKSRFATWYSYLSMNQFDKETIHSLGSNPFYGFKPCTVSSVLRRISPFLFLLRYKNGLTTYDEKRAFLAEQLAPKGGKENCYMIPPSNGMIDVILSENINLILKDKIRKTLDKSNLVLDEILSNKDNFPENIPVGLIHVSPVLSGLRNIRNRLISITNMHLDNPLLHIKETLNLVFSYENDLFTNREGSSKAKRYHNFNKLALAFSSKLRTLGREEVPMSVFTKAFGNIFSMAQVRTKEIKYRSKYRDDST